MNRPLIVTIEKPYAQVIFDDSLDFADVIFQGRTYSHLPVKKFWLGQTDYVYQVIIPIAPLPAQRWLLAISNDAIFARKHPEREPFPELQDSEPMEFKPAKKGKKNGQMSLWGNES